MQRYLAIVSRPADVDAGLIAAHKHYLQTLLQAGSLQMSGPFVAQPGGAYIFYAADLAAAEAVVANDPLLADSRATIKLHAWAVRLEAGEGKA